MMMMVVMVASDVVLRLPCCKRSSSFLSSHSLWWRQFKIFPRPVVERARPRAEIWALDAAGRESSRFFLRYGER